MYIEGRNAVLESLRSDRVFKKLYVEKDIFRDEKVKQILSKATNRKVITRFVSKKELEQISYTGNHQGIIAHVEDKLTYDMGSYIDYLFDNKIDPFFVYIRESLYEQNLGAIIRSAECVGANAVVTQPKVMLTAETVRASAGATEHVNIMKESLFNAIKICQKNAIKVIGIEVSGDKFYYQEDLTGPAMFIIGGEDRPLSMEITKKCDIIVKIPMFGKVNSLNMSVAASIVLYDKVRQESNIK